MIGSEPGRVQDRIYSIDHDPDEVWKAVQAATDEELRSLPKDTRDSIAGVVMFQEQRTGWGSKIAGLAYAGNADGAYAVLDGLKAALGTLRDANQNTEVDNPDDEGQGNLMNAMYQAQIALYEYITGNELWDLKLNGEPLSTHFPSNGKLQGQLCNSVKARELIRGLNRVIDDMRTFDSLTDSRFVLIYRRLHAAGIDLMS